MGEVLKRFILFAALVASASAFAGDPFPSSPDPRLTPGSLCGKSSNYRYPERISYCPRDVDSNEKREIIARYDRQLGTRIGWMNRAEFKIDHYIPLCMGGGNELENLWPQHMSVYAHTDPIEELACKKMAEGRLRQADAIKAIRRAKADPQNASVIYDQLKHL